METRPAGVIAFAPKLVACGAASRRRKRSKLQMGFLSRRWRHPLCHQIDRSLLSESAPSAERLAISESATKRTEHARRRPAQQCHAGAAVVRLMLVAIVVLLVNVGCEEKTAIEPVSLGVASEAVLAPTPAPPPVASTSAATSLCSELDRWTKDLVESSLAVEQVLSRYKAKNQGATGVMELVKISGDFRSETAAKGHALRQRATDLEIRKFDPKEAAVRDRLLAGYKTTATAFERYSEAFGEGTKGFPILMKISQTVDGISKVSRALDADAHRQCAGT